LAVRELLACYFDGSAEQLREYLEQAPHESMAMAAAAGEAGELQLDASLL
jgi:hypothetical protein